MGDAEARLTILHVVGALESEPCIIFIGGLHEVNALDGLDLMLCFFTSTRGPTIDIHLMETGETYV